MKLSSHSTSNTTWNTSACFRFANILTVLAIAVCSFQTPAISYGQDEAAAEQETEVEVEEEVEEEVVQTQLMRALIVDGQNNHKVWPKTTQMMRRYLEQTGMFIVDVATTKPEGTDEEYSPDFSQYAVVISNYNGSPWTDETKTAFDNYMKEGGGLVIVHAADNAFPGWREFNEMIGLGGWGGRNQESGPYVYFNEAEEQVVDESEGNGGGHGPQHEFTIVVREPDHPIMAGMPAGFLHTKDELYQQLRGPAANMKVLATAWADESKRGTSRHEPQVMTIDYGQGRVFHTTMGHADYSMECTGFIALLQRGTEWAATGEVTQEVPEDLPTADAVTAREFVEQSEASVALATSIESMILALETKSGKEAIELMVPPEELEEMKQAGMAEEIYERFDGDNEKKAVLTRVLKSIPRSLIEVDGDIYAQPIAEALGAPRDEIEFKSVDGNWYIKN